MKNSLKRVAVTVLLPAINKLARLVSLKVVPLSTPNRDFTAFIAHLRRLGVEFKSVIDVGIAFGTPALYASTPNAKFYLVEPVPSCRPLLQDLAGRLDAETFNVAAGASDGSLDFFVHSDVSGSSAYAQHEGSSFDGERIKVPVRRLDSLIDKPLARPALLKIDTQGAELEVLAGASGLLGDIDVVIVEVSFHEFRQGAPEFHDIVIRMAELGFRGYEVLEGHYRSADNALAQVDLAFVKADSSLRATKAFFTQDQAKAYLRQYDKREPART
jgi:FkbM family methyltransferase